MLLLDPSLQFFKACINLGIPTLTMKQVEDMAKLLLSFDATKSQQIPAEPESEDFRSGENLECSSLNSDYMAF